MKRILKDKKKSNDSGINEISQTKAIPNPSPLRKNKKINDIK